MNLKALWRLTQNIFQISVIEYQLSIIAMNCLWIVGSLNGRDSNFFFFFLNKSAILLRNDFFFSFFFKRLIWFCCLLSFSLKRRFSFVAFENATLYRFSEASSSFSCFMLLVYLGIKEQKGYIEQVWWSLQCKSKELQQKGNKQRSRKIVQ